MNKFIIILILLLVAGTVIGFTFVEPPKDFIEEPVLEDSKKDLTKECFAGGCSGELCTDDAETISTCEILPGMECLKKEMSCKLLKDECTWVLSEKAANCFLDIKEELGEKVFESRIGYLFRMAEDFFNE